MQIRARKQFLGRVTGLNIGPVNAEVSVDIGGGDQMTALSANDSIYGLALKEGDPAVAVFKTPSVILGVAL